MSPDQIARAFSDNLARRQARFPKVATKYDHYMALAYVVRDFVLRRWKDTAERRYRRRSRTLIYLSAEYLLGPQLGCNILSLGLEKPVSQAMKLLHLDLEDLLDQEQEPGLGHGGLGRLAACYLESLATLDVPAIAHGIRYEFGAFTQEIRHGWQVEVSDKWLRLGNPWEVPRPEIVFNVGFGGKVDWATGQPRWIPDQVVQGMAYDMPVVGFGTKTVNLLRLWKAEAVESFDFQAFNHGDYYGAVLDKIASENITKALYPNDEFREGRKLRLQQEYFFASCALHDMFRIYRQQAPTEDLGELPERFAIQLNDTHPAIAVAEMMRILVDELHVDWDRAWAMARRMFSFTNHTLMPEALERWPLGLFGQLLPRHLEIIYEINQGFLGEAQTRFPGDNARLARMSLVDETGERYLRMAHLAAVGSHHVNGVAGLHSTLLRGTVMRDFAELWPMRFCNVTNGVSPRRFVALSNPWLARLITDRIGDAWLRDLGHLRRLEELANNAQFQQQWRSVKLRAKRALAVLIERRTDVRVNPESLFDVQVKRLHEYKRQHLNVLHILTLYLQLKREPHADVPARTFIFGAKAAPGYWMAKLIIKLINSVARVVNSDPEVRDRLKVVFLPNFNVKNAQCIYPAADLSEQISTAGKEASGTGNMKFSLNGALTIGTLDGANVEIREEVGPENFFLFGLTAEEIQQVKANGYQPRRRYEENPGLREVIDFVSSGALADGDAGLFRPLVDNLLHEDPFLVLADYQAYVDCQQRVSALWRKEREWTRRTILNVARMGKFSSDRSIREYCSVIWRIEPESVA